MKNHVEAALNGWLAKNHGVLTIEDATQLGLSRWDLYALIERGRLTRRHAGV
jgi:Transcriptional regulator, AbiEi antitoxin